MDHFLLFENPGEIDLACIGTFGVSVKESKNPIGFFGTGLKYALAVLLREKQTVRIHSGNILLRFYTKTVTIREKDFDLVCYRKSIHDPVSGDITEYEVELGFTTEHGKTWELWKAYRELYCNTKDEDGIIEIRNDLSSFAPEKGRTKIVVIGEETLKVHQNRHLYFLSTDPVYSDSEVEIHKPNSKEKKALFYRNINVYQYENRPPLFTYNIKTSLDLTEDRTCKHLHMANHQIAMTLLRCTDKTVLRKALAQNAESGTLEGSLDYDHYWEPSEEFLEVVTEIRADRSKPLNASALQVWRKKGQKENLILTELTEVQKKALQKAEEFCIKLGFNVREYPVIVTDILGNGVLGLAEDGRIYLSNRVFMMGTKMIAGTLLEEYLHLKHGLEDESRNMQNYLFDLVCSLGEQITGEPL